MANGTTTRRRRTKTIESVIGSQIGRPRSPGAFYKLAPAAPSLAMDVNDGAPYVDRAAMSARAVISTPALDRMGDVLVPEGIRLDNYRRNPVVLWAHGFEGITIPLGRSEDPDGNLTVRVNGGAVEATCFFSQSTLEAEQIFELIAEKIVRATSVRETPIKSSWTHDPVLGDFLYVEEWDLEEWSWCCVPVNQECVAKATEIFHRGRLAGRPIGPSIMKSLSVIAPELKALGVGLDFAKGDTVKVKYTKAQLKSMSLAQLKAAKADAEDPAAVEEEEKARKADDASDPANKPAEDVAEPEDTTTAAAESTDGEESKDAGTMPYGQQLLSAAFTSLSDCIKGLESSLGPLEQETVKGGLGDILSALKDQQTAIDGLHSSVYGKALGGGEPDGDEGGDAEAMKSFLALGKGRDLQVFGLASRLKSLSTAKNLTADQRKMLNDVDGHLRRLVSQAKSAAAAKPAEKPAPAAAAEDPEKIAALQKMIDDLKSKLPTA